MDERRALQGRNAQAWLPPPAHHLRTAPWCRSACYCLSCTPFPQCRHTSTCVARASRCRHWPQMVKSLFEAGDVNGNGSLDLQEFATIVRYINPTTKMETVGHLYCLSFVSGVGGTVKEPTVMFVRACRRACYFATHTDRADVPRLWRRGMYVRKHALAYACIRVHTCSRLQSLPSWQCFVGNFCDPTRSSALSSFRSGEKSRAFVPPDLASPVPTPSPIRPQFVPNPSPIRPQSVPNPSPPMDPVISCSPCCG
jgi:hypothetical protein